MPRYLRVVLTVVVLAALSLVPLKAQVAQAELRGTVTDESGGVLPGATVNATHVDTGVTRSTVTSAAGTYIMPALPIGGYTIKAELSGFGTYSKEGVRLGVGDRRS